MGFSLTALSGSAANSNNERKDIIHALDFQYNGLDYCKACNNIRIQPTGY